MIIFHCNQQHQVCTISENSAVHRRGSGNDFLLCEIIVCLKFKLLPLKSFNYTSPTFLSIFSTSSLFFQDEKCSIWSGQKRSTIYTHQPVENRKVHSLYLLLSKSILWFGNLFKLHEFLKLFDVNQKSIYHNLQIVDVLQERKSPIIRKIVGSFLKAYVRFNLVKLIFCRKLSSEHFGYFRIFRFSFRISRWIPLLVHVSSPLRLRVLWLLIELIHWLSRSWGLWINQISFHIFRLRKFLLIHKYCWRLECGNDLTHKNIIRKISFSFV